MSMRLCLSQSLRFRSKPRTWIFQEYRRRFTKPLRNTVELCFKAAVEEHAKVGNLVVSEQCQKGLGAVKSNPRPLNDLPSTPLPSEEKPQ